MKYADEEILLYDLSNRPASFDFVTCMATAVTHGVKHVRFVLGGWKPKDYLKPVDRFLSIVEPAVSLWGLDYSVGERRGVEVNHVLKTALKTYRKYGRLAKIPVECKAGNYLTVTLRNSRCPERNSQDSEWRKFADRCGHEVVFLEDGEKNPVPLKERMSLYAGALMNFMVINGPLTLCLHSDAPFLCMRTIGGTFSNSTSPGQFTNLTGLKSGEQFPWQNENQRLSYLDDTAENIMSEWNAMKMRKAA